MKTVYSLSILLLIASCEPDKDGICAGLINNDVTYNEITPTMQIINPGQDSIDVDNDSNYDFVFIKTPKALLSGFGIITEMLKKSNIQIFMDTFNKYPACLNYNDAINTSSNWSVNTQKKYVLQSYQCGSNDCYLIGNFITITNKYLAFRIGNKFGWILLDNKVPGELSIKGCAISK